MDNGTSVFGQLIKETDGSQTRGRQYGESLMSYHGGLSLIDSTIEEQCRGALNSANSRLEQLNSEISQLQRRGSLADKRQEICVKLESKINEERINKPANFAAIKGIIYLSLSFLLILADVSILGQVLARLLNYEWRSKIEQGESFAKLFFTKPVAAFHEFPDLFCLTISILVIGVFIKVWLDSYSTIENERGETSKYFRVSHLLYSIFFILSVLAVSSMALARWSIEIGGHEGGWVTQFVATILGFSLPFVSAGFFIRGYEVTAKRVELWSSKRQVDKASAAVEKIYDKLEKRKAQKAVLENQLSGSDKSFRSILLAHKLAYGAGYTEGLLSLLGSNASRPLYGKLRLIALAGFLRKSANTSEGTIN